VATFVKVLLPATFFFLDRFAIERRNHPALPLTEMLSKVVYREQGHPRQIDWLGSLFDLFFSINKFDTDNTLATNSGR
jgi:hypothetical protein